VFGRPNKEERARRIEEDAQIVEPACHAFAASKMAIRRVEDSLPANTRGLQVYLGAARGHEPVADHHEFIPVLPAPERSRDGS